MAAEPAAALKLQLARQVAHWGAAAEELGDLSQLASEGAWKALDRHLGVAIDVSLKEAVARLKRKADALRARLLAAESAAEIGGLRREVLAFRRRYLAVEATLDFYGDAVNSRTSPRLAAYLGACDYLARKAMRALLEPLGRRPPRVLTYLDKGLGASILKAGLPLWDDRTSSPVAAIKMVRHNLYRPTSLLHEAGHQVSHVLGWTPELARALERGLGDAALGGLWAGWASEIAADAFAFAHAGYASLAALHDVIAGDAASVLRVDVLDPHPAGYVRVLLGCAMCKRFFGRGPWGELASAWRYAYRTRDAAGAAGAMLERSLPALDAVAEIALERPYAAFGGKGLADLVDPARVRPDALRELERAGGRALYASSDWVPKECLRLLALSGWQLATEPERAPEALARQKAWLRALGEMTTTT